MQLPIDRHLGAISSSLQRNTRLLLQAEAGAGKTTRVPPHLLEAEWCTGEILVSEPRRLAARLSATRVAKERGEHVGGTIGYQVRLDNQTSKDTRITYLTEGLLLRRLLEGRQLEGVSALILDEVHERSADLDAILALLPDLQKRQPELRLVLMSATLSSTDFGPHFEDAATLTSEGRVFPVSLHYDTKEEDRALEKRVRSACRGAPLDGDILVFLPGAREIRACQTALEQLESHEILTLHGDLKLADQLRAVSPRRKGENLRIVLSTNVAESSLTIPDVTTVIDSGLARQAVFDPWTGVGRLETTPISQARCVQRAGRAGRVQEGRAIRLFTRAQFERRPPQDTPEILRSDLSELLLRLLASGLYTFGELKELPWASRPPDSAWEKAADLLTLVGALDGESLTTVGEQMSRLSAGVRGARLLVEGRRFGLERKVCDIAALLSEKDIWLPARLSRRGAEEDVVVSHSDLEDRLEWLEHLREDRFSTRTARDLRLDLSACRRVTDLAKQYDTQTRGLRVTKEPPSSQEEALSHCLLAAFPDRVAARRGKGKSVVLAGGTQATLHPTSAVQSAPFFLALSADSPFGKSSHPVIRLAHQVEADWLLDAPGDWLRAEEELLYDSARDVVREVSRLSYGRVVLDESSCAAPFSEGAARALAEAAFAKGSAVYDPEAMLERLTVRLSLLKEHRGELFDVDETASWEELGEALHRKALYQAALQCSSLKDLQRSELTEALEQALPQPISEALRHEVPTHVTLGGGRRLAIHYELGRPPWIESRLQDFFSMNETPRILKGRLALTLHFLAPNKRAVQVTTDLPGFWERHYPELRKQLMRRYPKHLWPEDGRTASPPRPGRIR